MTALRLFEIFRRAGVPPGVINVVIGSGEEVFNELIDNDKVAGISFTGSTVVGLQVASKAAGKGKKFMIAPSGSDPAIVFEDADLGLAVKTVVKARFENAGQNCNATKRVYVHRKIFDIFVKAVEEEVRRINVGDPMSEDTDMPPRDFRQDAQGHGGFHQGRR